jgi:alpha-tubulin suppressor-like RCC1 family protein/tRNA A-37 threonylcarbamoyl transferase component Bud32
MSSERTPAGLASLTPAYEIIREIGRGGTAVVYLARDRATGDEVAIKLIRAKYLEDEEAIARFAREARFVAQLDHPNVVGVREVLDLGSAGIALVMTHIDGRTLKQLIQEERPLRRDRVVHIMRDVASALAAAHALGIIHRDVKPENIFIDANDRALLADFGVARSMSGDTQLTMHGVAIGTPSYMAPEQIDGGELDGRADIYSLGLVAWEMFTGHRPWEGESLYAVLYHQRHHELPDVREMRQDVTDEIADVINGAIEKEPSARWQSMHELIAALDGAAPSRNARDHVPVSTETQRFIRPLTPAPDGPVVSGVPARRLEPVAVEPVAPPAPPAPVTPAPLASPVLAYFAPGELDEEVPAASPGLLERFGVRGRLTLPARIALPPGFAISRRRAAVGGAALLVVIALGFVATAVEGRSDTDLVPATPGMQNASSGEVARTARRPDQGRGVANGPAPATPLPESLSVAAAIGTGIESTTTPASPAESAGPHAPVGIALEAGRAAASVAKAPGFVPPPAVPPRTQPQPTLTPPSISVAEAIGPPARPKVSIVAGGLHTCLVAVDGRAFCWGGNDRGQVGVVGGTRLATPAAIGAELRFTAVAPGLAHSCAIARGGALWCWGENDHGQLGDRTTSARSLPTRSAVGHVFRSVAAGAAHTCGIETDGDAWCWGADGHGQLGDGGSTDRTSPVAVSASGERFSTIDVGWNFTCGLTGEGKALCWGENAAGQLGDGSTVDRRTPAVVRADVQFKSITAGNAHACGVTEGGDAYCWGRNASGELGDGTTAPRTTPVKVRSDERFVSIAAGAVHTCAVAEDGEAWCWGRNTYGQLGNGGTTDSGQPTRVAGGHIFASVRAFGSHTCGSTVSGEAFCWGYNSDGQLGDGTRVHRTRPVYVERPGG